MRAILPLTVIASCLLSGCSADPEKALVGSYKGVIDVNQMKSDTSPMAKVMMERSLTLVLRADKTFDLNMIFTLSGTWKVTQDKLILTGVDSKGMSNPNSKLSGPLEFKVSGTTLTPVAETKGLSFSFVKN